MFSQKDIEEAVNNERKRCEDIVQAARHGLIDKDFRAIVAWIRSGDTVGVEDSEE